MTDLQPGLTAKNPSKRPVYLVIAVLLVWVVGLLGAAQGCQTIDILHHPESVRSAIGHVEDMEFSRRQEAIVDAILQFRTTVTPLAVVHLLLGSLLTFTAGLTLLGRDQARKIALQVIVVYALFLPLDYALRRPMHTVEIDKVAAGGLSLEGGEVTVPPSDVRVVSWWAYRGALGLQLTILTLGVLAMTRPRVRAFFRAAAATDAAGNRDL